MASNTEKKRRRTPVGTCPVIPRRTGWKNTSQQERVLLFNEMRGDSDVFKITRGSMQFMAARISEILLKLKWTRKGLQTVALSIFRIGSTSISSNIELSDLDRVFF